MSIGSIVQARCRPLCWWRRSRSGAPWLEIVAIGAVGVYWSGLKSLWSAWDRPEYSHGYFIPLVAGYLFLRRMRDLEPAGTPSESFLGTAFVVAGLGVGFFGNLARIA